jgi:hypothetical protein
MKPFCIVSGTAGSQKPYGMELASLILRSSLKLAHNSGLRVTPMALVQSASSQVFGGHGDTET